MYHSCIAYGIFRIRLTTCDPPAPVGPSASNAFARAPRSIRKQSAINLNAGYGQRVLTFACSAAGRLAILSCSALRFAASLASLASFSASLTSFSDSALSSTASSSRWRFSFVRDSGRSARSGFPPVPASASMSWRAPETRGTVAEASEAGGQTRDRITSFLWFSGLTGPVGRVSGWSVT
jgi:hypothetical protein